MKAIDNIFNLLLFHDSYYSLSVRKYILVESRVMQRGFSEQTLVFTISFYHFKLCIISIVFFGIFKNYWLAGSEWLSEFSEEPFFLLQINFSISILWTRLFNAHWLLTLISLSMFYVKS